MIRSAERTGDMRSVLTPTPLKSSQPTDRRFRRSRSRRRIVGCRVGFASLLLLFSGCIDSVTPFLVTDREVRGELRDLIESVEQTESAESRFITNQRILALYQHSAGAREELLYLTSYVERFPEDQFNAYYLLLVAERYRLEQSLPFARYYYERIVKNHPDLLLDGEHSVHRICLTNLIELVEVAEVRVGYYKELLSRFGDTIDRGRISYELATTYEELGEWELAMQFYREFLNHPETTIPGEPDARDEITELVTLYDMPNKDWTFARIEDLISSIQRAIWSQNARYLSSLRSRVGFFAKAWEDEETSSEISLLTDLGGYLKSRIIVPGKLDRDSNDREAYLATYQWGYRIPTWYLFFRRLDFPADPAIHNQWEWAGIYLGEKPF